MSWGSHSRQLADLFAQTRAISDPDSPDRLALLREMRCRDDSETHRLVAERIQSDDPLDQVLALEVLGQFGFRRGRPWVEESLPVVISATDTSDPRVLCAAINALGLLADARALEVVLGFQDHEDAEVRREVALALPNVGGVPLSPAAVDGLLVLMEDPADKVRDWATFGLGVLSDADDATIRRALTERLDDPGGNTAGEALVGLARRGDRSILPRMFRLLEMPDAGNLVVEAAGELGDPELLPALERLKSLGWDQRDSRGPILDTAIEACSP